MFVATVQPEMPEGAAGNLLRIDSTLTATRLATLYQRFSAHAMAVRELFVAAKQARAGSHAATLSGNSIAIS